MVCAADKRFCYWTMKLPSMRLSSRKENKEYKRSSSKLEKLMRFSKILLYWFMNKEPWLVTYLVRVLFMALLFFWLVSSYVDHICFVDDVGYNIESAQSATAQAKSQLVKASKTQRSNSSLVIYYTCWWHPTLIFYAQYFEFVSHFLFLFCVYVWFLQTCLLLVIFGIVLLIVIIVLAA